MSKKTTIGQSSDVQQPDSTTDSIVPVEQPLSSEDKMVLYAVLQDIANELRRIKREKRQKHNQES